MGKEESMSDIKICYGCMSGIDSSAYRCPRCGFQYEKYMKEKNPSYLNPGEQLQGRYLIGKVLGAGGFGITYIGYDMTLQIPIAIKEYFPSEYASRNTENMTHYSNEVRETQSNDIYTIGLEKFLNEARSLAHFNKMEGIVSVTDFFYENNTGYLVMEYLPGKSLKEIVLSRNAPMGEEEVKYLIRPVLDALQAIHKEGLIHRDISPDNLIMGETGKLVLIDFGAAREISEYSASLTVVLKPGYAPLEQYTSTGHQGPWTDVYALCATMYFMVTHAVPEGATDRALTDHLLSLSELGMNVSTGFSEAIKKGLAVDYSRRFQSMQELKQALDNTADVQSEVQSVSQTQQQSAQQMTSNQNQQQNPYTAKTVPLYQNQQQNPYTAKTVPLYQNQQQNPYTDKTVPLYQNQQQLSYQQNTQQQNQNYGQYGQSQNAAEKKTNQGWLVVAAAGIFCVVLLFVGGYLIKNNFRFGGQSQETNADAGSTAVSGTYVTYKSVNMDNIPVYSEAGGENMCGKLPEGQPCEALEKKECDGVNWCKVDYCGKSGWIEEQYLRYISSEKNYFYLQEDSTKNVVFNNEESIKLHTEPKTKSPYAAIDIPYGTEFTVSELKNGWAKVAYNGAESWLDMKVAGCYNANYWQVEICNGSTTKEINLREKSNEKSKSLAKIPTGTVLSILQFKKGWGKISYNGKEGWIKLHYATPCSESGLPFSEDIK